MIEQGHSVSCRLNVIILGHNTAKYKRFQEFCIFLALNITVNITTMLDRPKKFTDVNHYRKKLELSVVTRNFFDAKSKTEV